MNEELKRLLDNARAAGANASQLQGIVDAYNLKKKDTPDGTGNAIIGGEIGGIAGASKAQSVVSKVNPTVDYLTNSVFDKNAKFEEPVVTFKSGAKAKVIAPIPQINDVNSNIKYANQLQTKIDNGILDDYDENNIASANGISKELVKAQVKNNKAQIDYFGLQEEKKIAKQQSQKLLDRYNFQHNTDYKIDDVENDFQLGKAIVADLKAKDKQSFDSDEQQQNKLFSSNPTELNNVARDNKLGQIKYENSLDFEALNNLAYIKERERKILDGATAKEVADFDYEEKHRKKANKIDKAITSTNITTASMGASSIPAANAIGLLRSLTTADETEDLSEKRKAYYGYSELSANSSFSNVANEKFIEYNYNLDKLNEKVANGIKPSEEEVLNLQNQEEELKRLTSNIRTEKDILSKYPTIRKQKAISAINDYRALKSNNLNNTELTEEEKKIQESGGIIDRFLGGSFNATSKQLEKAELLAYLKREGYDISDQATIDAINSDSQKDYSWFGEVGKNFAQPFVGAIKSVGDITGLRTEIDRRNEVSEEEFNPTQIGKQDRFQLTKTASTAKNIANTTSNVLGQLALSTAIGGIGRIATLGNVAKNVNAVANTLESVDAASKTSKALKGFKDLVGISDAQQAGAFLSSYDDAMKDADEFLDNPIAKGLYSYLVGQFNAKTSKIFDETKLPQLLQNVKPQFASIAKKLSSGDFDAELLKNTLKSATQKTLEYGKAAGINLLQEVSEETLTSGLTDVTKILFGDSETNIDKLIENAKETAIQTAIGTSLLGLGGAAVDVKNRNSGNAMNTLYNAAIYHDEATDAINKGFEQGLYNERDKNTKISILETAKSKLPQISIAEELIGKDFSRGQKAAFIGNLTSQSIINEKIKNTESEAIKEELNTKLNELKQQEKDILGNKITLNEDGTYSKIGEESVVSELPKNENIETNDKKVEEPSKEKQLKDINEGNLVTFEYNSESEVPEIFKDKISSKGEINGKPYVKVTMAKSLADFYLQEKTIPQENITAESGDVIEKNIIPALKEKLTNVTVDNDAELLNYAIDKVAEAPNKLKTDLGDELFNQVLAQTPTEKLQEGLDFLINNNPDSKDVDVLDKIISERESAATKTVQPKAQQAEEIKPPTNKSERLAAFKNKYVETTQPTATEQKQWSELSIQEKLALAKENLPQVDNLSNVEAIKVADANAKMLLGKLNKTKVENENIQEPIQTTDEGVAGNNEPITSKEGGTTKEGNGENLQSKSSGKEKVEEGSVGVGGDVETKRKETEAKIKRKDLFSDGGVFANELGGSGVNSVPTNHSERNGIEFVQFSNPNTGVVDVIMTGKSDNDFVGYYRIYENGKATNKWSSKFENQSRNKEDFKTMISGVQEMLPQGHEYTEKTSISTDGLRIWNQQLSRGYELQYDSKGNLITNRVAINGDAINNELGIAVNKGDFENVSVTNNADMKKVKEALLPYLQKFGLNGGNIHFENGTVEIDLPVLKNTKAVEQSLKETTQSETKVAEAEIPTTNVGVEEGSGGVELIDTENYTEEDKNKRDNSINENGYHYVNIYERQVVPLNIGLSGYGDISAIANGEMEYYNSTSKEMDMAINVGDKVSFSAFARDGINSVGKYKVRNETTGKEYPLQWFTKSNDPRIALKEVQDKLGISKENTQDQSLKETTKAETKVAEAEIPTTNVGVEEGSGGVGGDVEGFGGGTKIYRAGGKGRYFTTDKQYIQEGGFKGETREFEIPKNTKLLDLREEDYKGILDLATEEERSILRKPQAKNSIEAKEQGNIVDAILKRNGYDGYIIKDAGETKDFDTVVFRKDKSPDLKAVEQSLKEQPKSDIDAKKEAIETEKQQAITEATKPVVDLELLGDEQQTIDLITEKASGDKDGGKAKIRQHERIRVRLQALKDLIDCV